jgi:anthranilate synthase/aminodeoxychorismate synthase-like glutamine amidotransferase
MFLLIDNYDSFTYNLAQLIEEHGYQCLVRRNDAISLTEIKELNPRGIVISPGPGNPDEAGISLAAISEFAGSIPILGVCLGHQAIATVFGGKVVRAPRPRHGKLSPVFHQSSDLYSGVNSPFQATRYHSLVVEASSLPECLEVTSQTQEKIVMGIRHKTMDVEGVQFHPESVATEGGKVLLQNFFARVDRGLAQRMNKAKSQQIEEI